MYLAEDRVRGKSHVNMKISLGFSYSPFVDLMLGTRVETRRIMGSSLRQVRVRRYRHAGSGARLICLGNGFVDLSAAGFRFPS